jgi:hypothetical protein
MEVPESILDELIRQGKEEESRERVKIRLELFTVYGVFLYAAIAAWQLWAYHSTSVRQLRAYVNPVTVVLQCPSCGLAKYKPPTIKPGLVVQDVVQTTFQNGGQTPAYNLTAHGNWQSINYGFSLPKDFPYPDYNTFDKGNLVIFTARESLNPNKDTTLVFPVVVQDILDARTHKRTLYFYGHADYQDIFHKWRQSPFCYLFSPDAPAPSTGFAACPEHNNPD